MNNDDYNDHLPDTFTFPTSNLDPDPVEKTNRKWLWWIGVGIFGAAWLVVICVSLGITANQYMIDKRQATQMAQTQEVQLTSTTSAQMRARLLAEVEYWPAVISDTFKTDQNSWPSSDYERDGTRIRAKVTDDVYRWEVDGSNYGGAMWETTANTRPVTDFYLQVDVTQPKGSQTTRYGVQFRKQEDGGLYLFVVDGSGRATFLLWYGGRWMRTEDLSTSLSIDSETVNRIAVQAIGSHFVFFVNEQYAGEVEDDRLTSGITGLWMETHMTDQPAVVEFDNFSLQAPLIDSALAPKATAANIALIRGAQWTPILGYNFTHEADYWRIGEDKDSYAKSTQTISNGKYRWTARAYQGFVTNEQADSNEVEDFYLEVTGKVVEGPQSAEYGVTFRNHKSYPPLSDDYYLFSITNDGYFTAFLNLDDDWIPLINWTETSAIRPGEINQIIVLAEDSHFTFFINGVYVGECDDNHLPSGKVGLAISLNEAGDVATFEFERFVLRVPNKSKSDPTITL